MTHIALKKKAAEAIGSWKAKIISLLEEGVRLKEFKEIINAEQIALTIIAMIEGTSMISHLTNKHSYRQSIMGSVEHYKRGIM